MDNFKELYEKLNTDQKKAVDMLEGPLLILAGPGTGKTELLSVRAANIIARKKAGPENILILTYTNAAAKAMKQRLVRLLGASGYDIETGTFHSFANSIILESEEAANYIQDRIQITEIERVKSLEYILDRTEGIGDIRPFRAPYTYRREIEKRISELKKEGITPKEFEAYVAGIKPDGVYIEEKHVGRLKALAVVYKLYEEYKAGKNRDLFDERGRYDFDDMIIFALKALKHRIELKNTLREQYRYIMVDEYQDTNGAQMSLLFELIDSENPNLCCVGDDDQSIYRFQGASVGNFKVLKEKFGGITIISLKNNYRSTGDIIQLSDKIIKNLPDNERMAAKELIPKKEYKKKAIGFHEFTTETEELIFITEKVKEIKSLMETSDEFSADDKKNAYNNIAVLVRKRDSILKVTDAFLRAGIPYATDGKEDIGSEKRVRQMLDVLDLAYFKGANSFIEKDAIFYRIVTSDYLKVHISDILKFIGYVNAKRQRLRAKGMPAGFTLFSEFLSAFDTEDIDRPPTERSSGKLKINRDIRFKDVNSMHRAGWVIKRLLKDAENRPVHSILMQYIDDAGVYKHILQRYADDRILRIRELRALSSFVNMIKEADLNNPAIRLRDFMDEAQIRKEHGISLTGNLATMTQEGVRVFTAHGSKGMEFHAVIMPFCLQDKNWPIRPKADLIPLPPEMFKTKEKVTDKQLIRELNFYDETRLFYVASTRAKSNLIYTASPRENAISSSYLSNIGLSSPESKSHIMEEPILIGSLRVAGMDAPFIGTEAILKDLVSNIALNPTSLNNYINCKRKFFYDNVLMLPSEKKMGLTFGNCVHKALEDTYRHFMEKNRFPDFEFFKKAFERELQYQGVSGSMHSGCLRHVRTLKAWFKAESRSPVKPIGLEKKLSIVVGRDIIFTGKYDKTELVDKGRKLVRVVDYKTGAPDAHIRRMGIGSQDIISDEYEDYKRQLVAYKLLFDKDRGQNKGFKVSQGMLVFVEPAKSTVIAHGLKKGEFINKVVDITDDMASELEGVIRECWRHILKLDFEKLPEEDNNVRKCRGCNYRDICWG